MWFLKGRYLTLGDVDELCVSLAAQVASEKFDYVVAIDRGGQYPGKKVAHALDVICLRISVRRPIDLSYWYQHLPRAIPALWQGVLFLTRQPVVVKSLSSDVELLLAGKTILIVDDVVQSGKTLKVATSYLRTLGAKTKTAVLASSLGGKADYCCIRGVRYYPWSSSSPEYPFFVEQVFEP